MKKYKIEITFNDKELMQDYYEHIKEDKELDMCGIKKVKKITETK